jgi:hypothetical protein
MFLRGTMAVMPPPPSIRRASKVIAALMFGNEIDAEILSPEVREFMENWRAKMLMAHGPGKILAVGTDGRVVERTDGKIFYKNTKKGARALTVEGAAENIPQLDRQAMKEAETNPDVARWLRCAVTGLVFSIKGAPAAVVAEIFRNSGDPKLAAEGPPSLASLDIQTNLNLTARFFLPRQGHRKCDCWGASKHRGLGEPRNTEASNVRLS